MVAPGLVTNHSVLSSDKWKNRITRGNGIGGKGACGISFSRRDSWDRAIIVRQGWRNAPRFHSPITVSVSEGCTKRCAHPKRFLPGETGIAGVLEEERADQAPSFLKS